LKPVLPAFVGTLARSVNSGQKETSFMYPGTHRRHVTDWNGAFTEPALVILTSTKDPAGTATALIETGANTGTYRGLAFVDSLSDDLADRIGVNPGDEITVRASVDPLVFDVATAATAGIAHRTICHRL
jgi:hypothetical protein